MNIENLLAHLTDFYYSHTVIAITLAVILLLLICFRPKAMLKTTGILLVMAVAVYFFTLFMDMSETGRSLKKDMVETVR